MTDANDPCVERDAALNAEKKDRHGPAQIRCTVNLVLQQTDALEFLRLAACPELQ